MSPLKALGQLRRAMVAVILIGMTWTPVAVLAAAPAQADLAAPGDSGMRLAPASVSASDNGYLMLVEAVKSFKPLSAKDNAYLGELLAGKHDDLPGLIKAADIVKAQEGAVDKLTMLAMKVAITDGDWDEAARANKNFYENGLALVRFTRAYSYVLAHDGQADTSVTLMASVIGTGNKILRSPNPTRAYEFGLEIRRLGIESMQDYFAADALTDESMELMAKAVAGKPEQDRRWLENFIKSSYEEFLVGLTKLQKDAPDAAVQPNVTRKAMFGHMKTLVSQSELSCGKGIKYTAPPAPKKGDTKKGPNSRGEQLVREEFSRKAKAITTWRNEKCLNDVLAAATMTMVGLRKNENAKKKAPSTLTALVPAYLEKVPTDPFSGKAMKYSAKKKIIYSVGPNLRDEGGSTGKDWRKMADPTFAVRPVPPVVAHVMYGVLLVDQQGLDFGRPDNDVLWSTGHVNNNEVYPAVDLRVECKDGRKVGINYLTREIDNYGVPVSMLQLGGRDSQWMFLMDSVEGCTFLASAHDTATYLRANPEETKKLKDDTERFNIYARIIDPKAKDGGIYTSETLKDEAVKPGEMAEYRIGGTVSKPIITRVGTRKE